MSGKLKLYQVIDVQCGGVIYKVRHKVTNEIFTWKAYDGTRFTEEQIENICNEVKTLSKLTGDNLLRCHDTIFHTHSRTLYLVLEFISARSLEEISLECKRSNKYIQEGYLWYLLHELARACKAVEDLNFSVLQKRITSASVYIHDNGAVKINVFQLESDAPTQVNSMQQVGELFFKLCYHIDPENEQSQGFTYSEDLQDVVSFLLDDKNSGLKPDVILYHPTVLAHLESSGTKSLSDVLISLNHNVELENSINHNTEQSLSICNTIQPAYRSQIRRLDSPTYANVSPKQLFSNSGHGITSPKCSLSPTLAALALELPGFVPRRTLTGTALTKYGAPQRVTENTLSNQWMSRLIALRKREENLNRRERDLISKEILNSPNVKIIPLHDADEKEPQSESNGITLPPVVAETLPVGEQKVKDEALRKAWASRRSQRRSGSVRTRSRRRKSYGHEDLDSSLSADPGDGSMIITAKRITRDNMPRNLFPDAGTKKVHFTAINPFVESDDSVTLTYYELENVDQEGYQVPRKSEYTNKPFLDEISKFKYIDVEKVTLEKRTAMDNCNQSSPNKQAKFAVPASKKIFADITNQPKECHIRKTPSKSSLTSRTSNTSNGTKCSNNSGKSFESETSKVSFQSCVSNGVQSGARLRERPVEAVRPLTRQSHAAAVIKEEEVKKPKSRKSMLSFKTPFKFMSDYLG